MTNDSVVTEDTPVFRYFAHTYRIPTMVLKKYLKYKYLIIRNVDGKLVCDWEYRYGAQNSGDHFGNRTIRYGAQNIENQYGNRTTGDSCTGRLALYGGYFEKEKCKQDQTGWLKKLGKVVGFFLSGIKEQKDPKVQRHQCYMSSAMVKYLPTLSIEHGCLLTNWFEDDVSRRRVNVVQVVEMICNVYRCFQDLFYEAEKGSPVRAVPLEILGNYFRVLLKRSRSQPSELLRVEVALVIIQAISHLSWCPFSGKEQTEFVRELVEGLLLSPDVFSDQASLQSLGAQIHALTNQAILEPSGKRYIQYSVLLNFQDLMIIWEGDPHVLFIIPYYHMLKSDASVQMDFRRQDWWMVPTFLDREKFAPFPRELISEMQDFVVPMIELLKTCVVDVFVPLNDLNGYLHCFGSLLSLFDAIYAALVQSSGENEQFLSSFSAAVTAWMYHAVQKCQPSSLVDKDSQQILDLLNITEIEQLPDEIKDELENLGVICVEKFINEASERDLSNFCKMNRSDTVRRILSNVFRKAWPVACEGAAELKDDQILSFILKWPLVTGILQKTKEQGNELLDEECMVDLSRGITVLENYLTCCTDGFNISLDLVKRIFRARTTVSKIVQVDTSTESLLESLCLATGHFNKLSGYVEVLSQYLDLERLNCGEFLELKRIVCSSWDAKLSDIVDTWDGKRYTFSTLGITASLATAVNKLQQAVDSLVFRRAWKWHFTQHLSRYQSQLEFTLDGIVPPVFQLCQEDVTSLLQKILSGQILLCDLVSWLKKFDPDFISKSLEGELANLCSTFGISGENIAKRTYQIQRFLEIQSLHLAAETLYKVFEKMGLERCTDEVRQIGTLASERIQSQTLEDVTEQLLDSAKKLESITPKRNACLQRFVECWDLVKWVRYEAGKDEKELHSFVDIATTNVGESDAEIAMVNDFDKAITGYAPLVYLENTSIDLSRFLKSLEKIWNALDNDPNLPEKLLESKRNRNKIEALHSATGKLERSSVQKVEDINRRGVFEIGNLKGQTTKEPDLEASIRLTINNFDDTGDGSDEVQEVISMADMRDLHSRLMLIGGQMEKSSVTKVQIDAFSKVYDSVQRIGNLFADHHKSGNVLLSRFSCWIPCSVESSKEISVRLHDEAPVLKETVASPLELDNQIEALIEFLGQSLADWTTYITGLRSHYPELNYFSNRQG